MIESGDSGVFVTCDMGREGKCTAEALDLFSQVSNAEAFPFLLCILGLSSVRRLR